MDTNFLIAAAEKALGADVQLFGSYSEGGGEFNSYFKLLTDKGVFFVKIHPASERPKTFEREKNGLAFIRKTQTVDVVNALGTCIHDGFELLFLDYLEATPAHPQYWTQFGRSLAKLHRNSNRYFGFQEDNFINGVVQLNNRIANWGQFFVTNRLLPNIRRAFDQQLVEPDMLKRLEEFLKLAENVFPEEAPSLVHGNLWRKHVLTNANGMPVLISPSVYYGHREMDLALTRFVGSFEPAFYEAYMEEFPLEPDWEVRMDFCNMYYLLVYLNSYGAAYAQTIEEKLNKWVGN